MASQPVAYPRWHNGQLRCGDLVAKPLGQKHPPNTECAMGFWVAELSDSATPDLL